MVMPNHSVDDNNNAEAIEAQRTEFILKSAECVAGAVQVGSCRCVCCSTYSKVLALISLAYTAGFHRLNGKSDMMDELLNFTKNLTTRYNTDGTLK